MSKTENEAINQIAESETNLETPESQIEDLVQTLGIEIEDEQDAGELPSEDSVEAKSSNNEKSKDESEEKSPDDILEELSKDETEVSEEGEQEEQSSEELFEVPGAEDKVSKQELINGYMRQDDYTRKTQSVADERKELEEAAETLQESVKEAISQHSEKLENYDLIDAGLKQLEQEDPDLYQDLQEYFQGFNKQFKNPQIESLQNKIDSLSDSLKNAEQTKHQNTLEEIKEGYHNEVSNFKESKEPQFKKLGLTVNWNKVKEVWVNDESEQMTVEQAVNAVHGEDIVKLYNSKIKVQNTKKKNFTKTPTAGSMKTAKTPAKQESWKGNYDILADKVLKGDLDIAM